MTYPPPWSNFGRNANPPPQPPYETNGWGRYVAQSIQYLIDRTHHHEENRHQVISHIQQIGEQVLDVRERLIRLEEIRHQEAEMKAGLPPWWAPLTGQLARVALVVIATLAWHLVTGKPLDIRALFAAAGKV